MEEPSISIQPATLRLALSSSARPTCEIILNSQRKGRHATFKIKTTVPGRYIVQPNSGLVVSGKMTKIQISMIERECEQLLKEGYKFMSKDKFLVQIAHLESSEYDRLYSLDSTQLSSELTRIWSELPKEAVSYTRIPVEFSSSDHPISKKLIFTDSKNGMQEGIITDEFHMLHRKHNDLVRYTVNLSEVRDITKRQLEEAKRALKKETLLRLQLETKLMLRGINDTTNHTSAAHSVQTFLGRPKAFLIIILCALIGGYTASNFPKEPILTNNMEAKSMNQQCLQEISKVSELSIPLLDSNEAKIVEAFGRDEFHNEKAQENLEQYSASMESEELELDKNQSDEESLRSSE